MGWTEFFLAVLSIVVESYINGKANDNSGQTVEQHVKGSDIQNVVDYIAQSQRDLAAWIQQDLDRTLRDSLLRDLSAQASVVSTKLDQYRSTLDLDVLREAAGAASELYERAKQENHPSSIGPMVTGASLRLLALDLSQRAVPKNYDYADAHPEIGRATAGQLKPLQDEAGRYHDTIWQRLGQYRQTLDSSGLEDVRRMFTILGKWDALRHLRENNIVVRKAYRETWNGTQYLKGEYEQWPCKIILIGLPGDVYDQLGDVDTNNVVVGCRGRRLVIDENRFARAGADGRYYHWDAVIESAVKV